MEEGTGVEQRGGMPNPEVPRVPFTPRNANVVVLNRAVSQPTKTKISETMLIGQHDGFTSGGTYGRQGGAKNGGTSSSPKSTPLKENSPVRTVSVASSPRINRSVSPNVPTHEMRAEGTRQESKGSATDPVEPKLDGSKAWTDLFP
ncbi:hypothetical protein R1sor_024355 [Riccia sorocarpa]|uniref:Uncharacterized protein n=1 Tax=Riccia sorocarpa TaxID=122646 RepID=A0ABD3GU99_9MARC